MPSKTKKKISTKPKKSNRELKQVFDSCGMPSEFGGIDSHLLIVAGGNEEYFYEGAPNCQDTYQRWYPGNLNDKVGKYEHFISKKAQKAGKLLNQWLLDSGMVIKDEFCFHVLIHINW